jgi:hypothetical protein
LKIEVKSRIIKKKIRRAIYLIAYTYVEEEEQKYNFVVSRRKILTAMIARYNIYVKRCQKILINLSRDFAYQIKDKYK